MLLTLLARQSCALLTAPYRSSLVNTCRPSIQAIRVKQFSSVDSTAGIVPSVTLRKLLETDRNERDDDWMERFKENIYIAKFEVNREYLTVGPDGFKYIEFMLPRALEKGAQSSGETHSITELLDNLLIHQGFGVVIKSADGVDEWVFSYGDIVNLCIGSRESSTYPISLKKGADIIAKDTKVLMGAPPEEYLPQPCRDSLRAFLQANGVAEPRVVLIQREVEGETVKELAFVGRDYTWDVFQRIPWFLPRHYAVVKIDDLDGVFEGEWPWDTVAL